ncbi:MAG: hypothetical protein JNL13_12775 [Chitinophagaceae bacterium]|nr:hypothetical protein [Chitinophagaceae bacterium]
MRLNVFIFLIIIIQVGCIEKNQRNFAKKSNNVVKEIDNYPPLIDSLGFRSKYDKTKWFLYCRYCDEKVLFTEQSKIDTSITFASLDLKFDTLIIKNNLCEMNFRFYFKDSLCDYRLVENRLLWGCVFQVDNDSIIKFSGRTNARYFQFESEKPEASRFQNLSHPDVINYINANKDKLNPWFREEAVIRGVIR